MTDRLSEFLDHLRLNRNTSAHTVAAYGSDLSQFLGFAAGSLGKDVTRLRPADLELSVIRAFMAELYRRGQSRASVARKLSALRSFVRYLRREGLIETDPASLAVSPRREQRVPAHLSVDEMSRLLEAPDASSPLGRRDRAILELFYASGLRLAELVGLDVEDVNLAGRIVRVAGKGRKERLVPFNTSAQKALRAWYADRARLRAARGAQSCNSAAWSRTRSGIRECARLTSDRPQRPAAGWPIRLGLQRAVRHQSARAAPFLRHAPVAAGRRSAGYPGAVGARPAVDDAALHACECRAASRGIPQGPPTGEAELDPEA